MESDESINQSVFLNSFSRYSDQESSADIETVKNVEESVSSNPITTSMNEIMNYKIRTHAPLTNLMSVANLLNKQQDATVLIPNRDASVLKKNASIRFHREFILLCGKCQKLCDENGKCRECKTIMKKGKSNFVVKISIEQQIKYLVHKHFGEILKYANREKDGSINDIDDGLLFKNLVIKNPDSILLTFTINSDGAQIYNSKNLSMWPIQLCANFLPPNIRFKSENILLCMLYISKEKPNFIELFYPLAKEINELQEKKMKFFYNEKVYTCVPIILLGAFDLPARAMASGMKQYSGEKSCVYCLHPGKQITDRFGQKYIRYVRINQEIEIRNHCDVISSITKMNSKDKYGLINVPPMTFFNNFDLTNGYSIDYMHNILLGITKHLIDLWFGEHRLTKGKAPILPKDRILLSQRLIKLKPCSYITRKPRSLMERGKFKAIEYRNLLLFYLRFALNGLLHNDKIKHFELLSAATYILLKSKISEGEVLQAGDMLIKFADQFESIYGQAAVTMNIHILRHYALSVVQCGPLWSYSMFPFEKKIGILKKSIHNPTDALDTITLDYCLKKTEVETTSMENFPKIKRKVALTPKEKQLLVQNNIQSTRTGDFEASDSMKTQNHNYKSKKSRANKSIDYFVQLRDDTIGCIEFFVNNCENVLVMIELYEIVERHHHLLRIKATNEYNLINSNQLYCKLIYMKFGCFEIVSREPNFFETT